MVLAHPNEDEPNHRAADPAVEAEALASSAARNGTTGPASPTDRQSEGERDYGRQGGSIVETGERTEDPVGVEQAESSAVTASRRPPDDRGSRPAVTGGMNADRAAERAPEPLREGDDLKARQDRLLDEALEETFPGSDPISPKRIT